MTFALDQQHHPPIVHPTGTQRLGYGIAIVLNGLMLYTAHHLLEWGWLGFLTRDFEDLLPLITASLVFTIVANVFFMWRAERWVKPLANVVTAAIGFLLAVRTWQVFPFDFTTYSVNWSWLFRTGILVAMLGTAVGFVVDLAKVIAWRLLK